MSWLPKETILGPLVITETFVDYDGPRVFACLSETGQRFLAAWAEEGPEADRWLYLPISEGRLAFVRSGGWTLRAAFEHPEAALFLATLPHSADDADAVEVVARDRVEDSWLPGEQFRLVLDTPTVEPADDELSFLRRARQEGRPRIRVMVKLPNYRRTEAPTRRVGELLLATQNLYDNFGSAELEQAPPQAGKLSERVLREMATDVVGLSAASFVVELAGRQNDDLFGDTEFSRATDRVMRLLEASVEREELVAALIEVRPRAARSFRSFVKALLDTTGSVCFAAASSAGGYRERELSNERLSSLHALLSRIVPDDAYEVRGWLRLFAADLERKRFGAADDLSGDRFEGRAAERALAQLHHAELDQMYDMVIVESRVIDEATGERKSTYVLEQLTAAEGDRRPVESVPISGPGAHGG